MYSKMKNAYKGFYLDYEKDETVRLKAHGFAVSCLVSVSQKEKCGKFHLFLKAFTMLPGADEPFGTSMTSIPSRR